MLISARQDGSEMQSYGRTYKLLHWGMALLVIAAIMLVEFKGLLPGKQMRHEAVALHVQAGLCVFLLVWVRIAWRSTHAVPPVVPPLSRAQETAAHLVHAGLYILMAVLPFLGILALQSKGRDVSFLGMPLPILLDEQKGLPYSLSIRSYHELLGNILIATIVLHVLSAWVHHLVRRDNTLKRMLPL